MAYLGILPTFSYCIFYTSRKFGERQREFVLCSLSALKEETKRSEKPHTEGSLKDKMSAVEKSSSETSDDLSSLILSKMRGKTVGTTSQKDNARAESQTSNASSTTITASTSTSTDGKSIEDSKWAQVMSSIRKIAAKNKAGEATGKSDSSKMKENENVDDFADLDLPHQRSDPSLSRSQSRSSVIIKDSSLFFRLTSWRLQDFPNSVYCYLLNF